ncbi:MAG: tripeptide aminopeptidase PepT, partial [Pygmaiobacter sp.]
MRAYERLIEYAEIYTTSDPNSGTSPSAERERDLSKVLCSELLMLGLADARVDEKCYVYATLPASHGCEDCEALGFIAHVDTAPDAPGENVHPQLHPDYDGKDVLLAAGGITLSPAMFPHLATLKGQTLITTDGTTLLGADDKAGVAEIMTALERIVTEQLPHPKICVAFTPDEEVGEGADHFDVANFGARFAYTVDGEEPGLIEYETFNAAEANFFIKGISVHP